MKKTSIAVLALACTCTVSAETSQADTISLQEVEIVANRATAKTPVAFTNVRKADIER